MNRAALEHVIQGQAERNVMKATQSHYLSKLRVMTGLLNEAEPAIRNEALEIVDGDVRKHTGDAKHIYVLKLPMSADTAKLLFAYISINRHLAKSSRRKKKRSSFEINQENACTTSAPSTGDSIMNERDLNPGQNVVTVSAQTYQNYKSALRWWHEYDSPNMSKVGHVWPVEVDRAICAAIATYKRDIGLKKRNGIMKVRDGKLPYNLYGYKTICAHFMSKIPTARSQSWHEGLFASLFTKLSVNTIGRSDNIDDILTCNMDWINDALTIVFGTTKVDQTGTKTTDMKRLYANPFMPEVCVILDLAVYVWCKHCTSTEDAEYVFDGADQEKRYYNLLVQAVEKDIDSSLDLGCAREDIGTHSNRKFAESTSVSRIDGPSRTQVCLRAGQGVGRTQDCYMFSEDDGDALVGRTVAQLKLNADEFDVLPPHWCNAAVIQLNEYGWGNILPSYNYYCEGFQRIIRMLFASLVYHHHEGNIKRLYHPRHPIHCQPIFTDPTLLNSLKDKVLLCHQYCTDTGMSAEGVPGIILISREIRNFKAEVDKDKSSVLQRLGVVEETLSQKLRELHMTQLSQAVKSHRTGLAQHEACGTVKSSQSINDSINRPLF